MAIQQNTGFRMMGGGLEDTPLTMSEDASRTAFDQVTSGISNLYQNMLQRSPDAGGLQYWVDQVNSGKATLNDVSNAFKGSTEFLGTQLRSLNSLWDAEVANQEQPGIQSDIKTGSVDFGGRNWTAFRSPDGGVQISTLNADQSGIGSGQYRADFLDPDTGEVTTRVLDRNKTTDRLGKVLIGTMAALIAAPQLAGSLFGTEAAAGLGADLAAGGLSAESLATLNAIGPGAVSEIIAGTGAELAGLTGATAGATAGGLLSGASDLAVAGVEGAASQAATSAYAQTLAATGNTALASVAADVASGNVAAGLSVSDAVAAGVTTAADAAATGAVTGSGNIVGGGGTITTGTTGSGLLSNTGTLNLTGLDTLSAVDTTPSGSVPGGQSTVPGGSVIPSNAGDVITAADYTKLFGNLGSTLLSGFKDIAGSLLSGLAGNNQSNTIGQLINAGVNYQQAKAAADDLLKSGQISQQQYNALASNIQGQYNTLGNQFSGMAGDVRQTYNLLSSEAGQNVGEFTPYGITKNLFGPAGENIQASAMRAAQQSFDQAGLTNVDQLSKDYYNKLAALSAPEQQRQRLATEERLRAQGRLGVSGSAYGGTSPELLAQEQAIAQQQLQRELQSRQAALGERGTLLSQGTAALQPATQLGQFGLNTAQQQFANDLLRQQYLTGLKSQGVQGEVALRSRAGDLAARGIESAGVLQRQGLQDLLARQLQATAARSGANQQLTQGLLGGAGGSNALGGVVNSALGNLFNPNAAGNVNSLGFGTGLGYGNQDIGLFI
jgi:hypothetical protein